ncbi:hypothetical protein [Naumannella halotolerans]|uniref:Head-to-tail adaptor n=1 Tax=Naumannella halotolerans TaxID=993414 RepID=A0A4R7J3H1_9ACTN|nr:hypothetical protein [Naumannella halotolerans]TDT30889.1 hypothetical protein CLV29_2296 [Naumannella halotolerans]
MLITPADIAPFATIDPTKLAAMIDDAEAMAHRLAPCLTTTTDPTVLAAAKAIVRGAILRWNDAGTGAITQETHGPFARTIDNTVVRRGMFWPSEIADLQGLCRTTSTSGAFTIDTLPFRPAPTVHPFLTDTE